MDIPTDKKDEIMRFFRDNNDFSIIYHLDCDGITSATILSTALEHLGKRIALFNAANYEDFDSDKDFSDLTENVVVCDMQLHEDAIRKLSGRNLCVIDHHVNIEANNMTYLNPKSWGYNRYTPCALVMYELFKDVVPDADWISAMGVVSDAGGKENHTFIEDTAKRYDVKMSDDEYAYKNDFGAGAALINAMVLEHGRAGAQESVELLSSAKSLKDVVDNEMLKTNSAKVSARLKEVGEEFERMKENHNDIIFFFEGDPAKKKYVSAIITPISLDKKYYGKVIVFMTKIKHDTMRINMRSNGLSIKLPVILAEIFKSMGGRGGGHDAAAGALIRPEDKEKFKKLFLEEVNKQLKYPAS